MKAFATTTLARTYVLLLSLILAFDPIAWAQDQAAPIPPPANATAPARPAFSQQELDQMLAPIALYPDPLLSQILMASTYPLEIVEAARWSRANPTFNGDAAAKAVEDRDWDPSVKSLVAFPQILQMMDEKLDWTERLGDAFLAQEAQVMSTVQGLRQKAYAAGNLSSSDQMQVEQQGQTILIEPANPDLLYVPYYDPTVVYGPWWWADYPPVYWAPWPGYYYFGPGFAWGIGITITTGFFFGDCDWRHHRVDVVNVNSFYYRQFERQERNRVHNVNLVPGPWEHNPHHRRGVPYRQESLRQRYPEYLGTPESRREYRGYTQPPPGGHEGGRTREFERGAAPVVPSLNTPVVPSLTTPVVPSLNAPVVRSLPGNVVGSPSVRVPETRSPVRGGERLRQFEGSGNVRRNMPPEQRPPPTEIRPHAFEGIGRGSEVRDFSSRGRSSHEDMIHRERAIPRQQNGFVVRPSAREPVRQPGGAAPGAGRPYQRRQDR